MKILQCVAGKDISAYQSCPLSIVTSKQERHESMEHPFFIKIEKSIPGQVTPCPRKNMAMPIHWNKGLFKLDKKRMLRAVHHYVALTVGPNTGYTMDLFGGIKP